MQLPFPPLLHPLRLVEAPAFSCVHGRRMAGSPARLARRRRVDRRVDLGVAGGCRRETLWHRRRVRLSLSGVVKGSQTTVRLPDGSLDVRFAFSDRGRGPKIRSLLALDRAGLIARLQTTGYNYLKVTVNERFAARGGTATWKNSAENETQSGSAPRFYVSMDGTPEEGAILVRAALRAPNQSLELWPSGVTNVSLVKTLVANNGNATKRITMYEATGLDFTPADLWLDENGELFMSGSIWEPSCRKAGVPCCRSCSRCKTIAWPSSESDRAIAAATIRHGDRHHQRRALRFGARHPYAQRDGNLSRREGSRSRGRRARDSERRAPHRRHRPNAAARPLEHAHAPRRNVRAAPASRRRHHNSRSRQRARVYYQDASAVRFRRAARSARDHRRPDGRDGKYTAPIGTTTATPQQAIDQVRMWKRLGAVQIKIYSSMDPALVPVIVREAHAQGMRVSGHIPAGMLAQDACTTATTRSSTSTFSF